ncbi:MAG TPA: relaxase/mobilization nuclease domain-containing protein [Puia sp.]|jgi:hypothetical protein
MVARIEPVDSVAEPLAYNEKKVSQGRAQFIHVANFIQEKDSLTYDDKLQRFQRLNELNARSQKKMLHATLNFSPADKLSNDQLSAIADKYMEGLKMGDHPYLVYRHQDARHPHIHIVTSLIRSDGSRVKTHLLANRLSEPTRKAIEQEFGLTLSRRKKRSHIPTPDEVQKIVPGSSKPLSESIDDITSSVSHHYHFTNLYEYNAILRTYNVTAETGGPGSKTRQHNGLYYLALDDQGNRVSPPLMSSQLPGRPTLRRLTDKFHHPHPDHLDHLTSIRQRIDGALDRQPPTLRAFVFQLQADGIEIIIAPRNGRNPHDQVFVDHRTRTAVTGETLGPAYTTTAVKSAIDHHPTPGQRQRPQQTPESPEGPRFSGNVPQMLSALLHTQPGSQGPDDFGQSQQLGPRRKL